MSLYDYLKSCEFCGEETVCRLTECGEDRVWVCRECHESIQHDAQDAANAQLESLRFRLTEAGEQALRHAAQL